MEQTRLSPLHRRSICAAVAALVLSLATPALAHLALASSDPAAGDELIRAPSSLRLRFTERVQLPFSEVRLIGPAGPVNLGDLSLARDSPQVLLVPIVAAMRSGTYTVRWRVAGADGHPISGEFEFRVAGGEEPASAGATPSIDSGQGGADGAAEATLSDGQGSGSASSSAEFAGVRWATFASLLAIIGAAAFYWAVVPRWARRRDHHGQELRPRMQRHAAGLGAGAGWILLLAAAVRLYLQSEAVGVEIGDASRLRGMLLGTYWGWGWIVQVAGAALAITGFLAARRGRSVGWTVATAGVVLAAFSPALSGHAAATEGLGAIALLADGLHVLGAGGWLGTLLLVVGVGFPLTALLPDGECAPAARALVLAFSPVALAFATLVVVTGVFAAWIHLGTLSALWSTGYGRVLLIKIALLLPVLAAGAYNWRYATPALTDRASLGKLRRSAVVELGSALLVLAATAFLVATPPPTEMDSHGSATVERANAGGSSNGGRAL